MLKNPIRDRLLVALVAGFLLLTGTVAPDVSAEVNAQKGINPKDIVYLSGPETKGKEIRIRNRDITLPSDAYVRDFVVAVTCESVENCPTDLPMLVIERDNEPLWISARSGRIHSMSPESKLNGTFDFVVEALNSSAESDPCAPPVATLYVYMGEDPFKSQYEMCHSEAPRPANYVTFDLVYGNPITYWSVDYLASYASYGTSTWNSKTGHTYFSSTTDEDRATLTIVDATNDDRSWGIKGVASVTSAYLDRGGYFATGWRVRVDQYLDDATKEFVMLHELGHVLGLHERYFQGRCNPDEVSVMEFPECGVTVVPTSTDVSRVNRMYKEGSVSHVIVSVDGEQIDVAWTDTAWAEESVEVTLQKRNGTSWSNVDWGYATDETGLRATDDWNTLQPTFLFYATGPGTYRVCLKPKFLFPTPHYGSQYCASAFVIQ